MSGRAHPLRRPSVLAPSGLGLDRRAHVPVDEPGLSTRSETRVKMFTDKAARGFVYVTGKPRRAGIVHLLADPMVRTVAERPHRLVYHVHGKRGRVVTKTHVPAFAVVRVDGTVMVLDFETRADLGTLGWQRRRRELRNAYLEDHGILYNAVDETTLRVEPLFSNLSMLNAWARQPKDRQATIAVRAAISQLGLPTTVGAVRRLAFLPLSEHDDGCLGQYDRVLPTVGEMALAGEIGLLHAFPLGDATPILAMPRRSA